MVIQGMKGMTLEEIEGALSDGARIKVYEYVLSFVLVTFIRRSPAYIWREGERVNLKSGLRYNLLSLLFGWWFVPPFGFINTVDAIKSNSKGGLDITDEVLADLRIYKMAQRSEGRGDNS